MTGSPAKRWRRAGGENDLSLEKQANAGADASRPQFHGLVLLPQRAVFDPAERTLFVADVHFGKAAAFRALGAPVPKGTTADNLARLTALMEATGAARLVVLGDLLHARAGLPPACWNNCAPGGPVVAPRISCSSPAITTAASPTPRRRAGDDDRRRALCLRRRRGTPPPADR